MALSKVLGIRYPQVLALGLSPCGFRLMYMLSLDVAM